MRRAAHMVALVLLLGPAAARADGKRLYEQKCLYCHSGTLTDRLRLHPSQWKRLVARMRRHSPLLFSENEATQIVHYLVRERHLVPKEPAVARAPRRPPLVEPAPQPQPQPAVAAEAEAAEAEEPETAEASAPETLPLESSDPEAEEKGPKLVAERCSKCHTTRRVYMKVESVDTGEAIIERMRHKTGSGISPDDADLIKRFLRARVGKTD